MDALSPLRLYARLAPTERGGFRLARLARRLVPRDRWNGTFDDGRGNALDLDLSTYPDVCMAAGLYERDTDRLLRRLLPTGGHLVDGGANLGYFTLRLADKAGRIDAFEPDPHNRARLLANLQRNGLPEAAAAAADLPDVSKAPHPDVRVHPLALSDAPGTLTFHRPADDSTRNHGETSRYGDGEPFDVPAVRVDTAVDAVPDLVKLDLEGGELAAVRGMTAWLTAPRPPAVVVEHNPPADARGGHAPGDVFRAFLDADPRWRCRRVRSWAAGHLAPVESPHALDGLGRQCNLLFTRDAP